MKKTKRVEIRLTEEQKEALVKASLLQGQTVTEYIIERLKLNG